MMRVPFMKDVSPNSRSNDTGRARPSSRRVRRPAGDQHPRILNATGQPICWLSTEFEFRRLEAQQVPLDASHHIAECHTGLALQCRVRAPGFDAVFNRLLVNHARVQVHH